MQQRRYLLKCGIVIYILVLYARDTESAAPVISGLPTDIYIGEKETGARLLYVYSILDPNSDAFSCTNTITTGAPLGGVNNPTGTEFTLKKNTATGKYELWTSLPGTTSLNNILISRYDNAIICTDTNGESSSVGKTVRVNLVAGEKDTINNVEGVGYEVSLSALGTGNGITVKTVTSTSTLGHTIIYNMISSPSFSPEFFTMDSSTGTIKTNRDLKYLDAATPTVYLSITAYDTTDNIKVYATQTVHLTNQNTIPTTTNMPLAETKLETLPSGTTLFTIGTSDPDTSQFFTYRFTCTPTASQNLFTLDANGNFKIATGKSLDYETASFINCSFWINDSIAEGGPFVYKLTVANDNEAPSFSDTMYYATTTEGTKGSVAINPGLTCTDPDAGDSTTYAIQSVNNSNRFAISSSGILTFNTEYDVDNSAMPSSVVLTVLCVDSGIISGTKKTGTSQITVTITDANDNAPKFSSPSYTYTVDQYTIPGSVIGQFTPTDADSGSNANMACSSVSSSSYSQYYTIGADCKIYLSKTINFATGAVVGYTVYAKDGGTPQLTGTTAVDIIYQEVATTTVSTTTVTTTASYNFFDHGANIALFVFALLMGLALLGLLAWCLARMCCGNGCANMCDCLNAGRRRRPRFPQRQVTPDTPPPKRRPPSPVYRQPTPPPKIVEQPRQLQLVRTIARPAQQYGSWRALPPGGFVRSAPTLPGYFG